MTALRPDPALVAPDRAGRPVDESGGAATRKRSLPLFLGIGVAVVTLVLDQATKWILLGPLQFLEGSRVHVLPFMDLALVWNTGISYGLFSSDGPAGRIFLAAVAAVAAVLLLAWLARERRPLNAAALGLLLGGAIGNGIDRVVHGAVVDFVLLHAGGFEWYVFNIADVAIVAGVGLVLYGAIGRSEAGDA